MWSVQFMWNVSKKASGNFEEKNDFFSFAYFLWGKKANFSNTFVDYLQMLNLLHKGALQVTTSFLSSGDMELKVNLPHLPLPSLLLCHFYDILAISFNCISKYSKPVRPISESNFPVLQKMWDSQGLVPGRFLAQFLRVFSAICLEP